MKVMRHWHRMPREVVDAAPLEVLKARMDGVWSYLVYWKVSLQGGSEIPVMAEPRSWKDYSWLPKPLRCSHEKHYQYDTATGACREELTNTTGTGADTSLQQGKTTTTMRKGSWKEEHTQGEMGKSP